ncbi:MAG: response regulator [Psychrosphaera sp.]|nr:response regulator [Psychrosphaera sp.]
MDKTTQQKLFNSIFAPVFNIDHIQKPTPKTERPCVLLVDDEVENLKVFTLLLEDEFELHCASSAAQAIEVLDSLKDPSIVQLVVSDHKMPNMSGTELFEVIRPKLPDSLFLLLTGTLNTIQVNNTVDNSHIFDLITKPIEPSEFLQRGHKAIAACQQRHKAQVQCDKLAIEIQVISEQLTEKKLALAQAQAKLAITAGQ